jgi:hypothetical protein
MPGIRDEVAHWTREDIPFGLIAERIGRLHASEEHKSALWVWAWSYRSAHGRQHDKTQRRVLAD